MGKIHIWVLFCPSIVRKLTENKWKPGTAKPELVEDWDQRLLVTTLERGEEGGGLVLLQEAEKDQVREKYITYNGNTKEASLR